MTKRIFVLGMAVTLLLTSTIIRCYQIATDKAYLVADTYNSKSYEISKLYPIIYDRNNIKLNNNTTSLYAVIKPEEKNMSELDKLFKSENIKLVTQELATGEIVIRPIDKYADVQNIRLVEVVNENSPDMLCRHLLDKACGGIETVLDEKNGYLSVNYSVDALGRILRGDNGTLKSNHNPTSIKVSIDSEIQKIAQEASKELKKGAVVITNVETSQLLASHSCGDDYVNRAVSSYTIGSIFKLVVSACALENNINPIYTCKNSIEVGDTTFHCQSKKSHGKQDMEHALANSCNCYFINLALLLGRNRLYETAQSFGFTENIELYPAFKINSGAFATKELLFSQGQLALIGFGQGVLTDSPLHFSSVISTIANGGIYKHPTLMLDKTGGKRIISKSTSETLKKYMHFVVTDGTGANADYKNQTSGKTATAQSGIYENGSEVLNTWFAGFYPYDNPKYSIVVMCEGGTSGAMDCCPVFRTIVEMLENL